MSFQRVNFLTAGRTARNLRRGLKGLMPSLVPDFSSDSRQQRFRAEFMVQYFSVRAKFDLPRRAKRLIARRRARAILRGEQVPEL